MKISYATNNLRSLAKMDPVELRPLTILVGANNSGKSTFLRSFQLLRQSIETTTTEPILWFGEYVDFGNFSTSVHKRDSEKEIEFKFNIQDLVIKGLTPVDTSKELQTSDDSRNTKNIDDFVIHSLSINNFLKLQDENSVLSKLEIHIEDFDLFFQINFQKDGSIDFYLNECKIINGITKIINANNSNIFSPVSISNNSYGGMTSFNFFAYEIMNLISTEIMKYSHVSCLLSGTQGAQEDNSNDSIDQHLPFGKRYDLEQDLGMISHAIAKLFPFQEENFEKILDGFDNCFIKKFNKKLKVGDYKDLQKEIETICKMNLLFSAIEVIGPELMRFFRSTSSVGPSRTGMWRYNRMVGLDVSEVTFDSLNFPMYLLSLHENGKLESLSDWLEEILGFRIAIEKHVGNISVNVVQHNFEVNIVDSGYGLSEILPVLTQVWANSIRQEAKEKSSDRFKIQLNRKPITIEQPELHLHSKHQVQIADALVSAINCNKSDGTQPLFIVETHSDILINRLGALIRKNKLNYNDVLIVLFSKRKDDPITTEIRTSKFTDEGTLVDWPYGFMNY